VIVVDASALVELLLQTPVGTRVEKRLERNDDEVHAPHLVDIEIAHALRRLVRMGEVSTPRAEEAIADLLDFDVYRYPHVDLLDRAWTIRANVTVYDAMYIALAEALGAPLLTCDARLSAAPGHSARIELIQ
jgi:predicted nucleic acid-binding protein